MATKVDIVSNALVLIGDAPIISFETDLGAGAVAGDALYSTILDYMLSITYWRFSIKQASLNKLSQVPLIDNWSTIFQMPTDLITLYRVQPRSDYQIYEDKIFSNQDELEADYAFRPLDIDLPPYFVEAFQYKLASDLSLPVVQDTALAQYFAAKYRDELPIAMAADARQHPQVPILDNPFTDIRRGGSFDFFGGNY